MRKKTMRTLPDYCKSSVKNKTAYCSNASK